MHLEEFHRSFNDCLRQDGFADQFYNCFFERVPEAAPLFGHIDMNRHRRRLKTFLYVAASYAAGATGPLTRYLRIVGPYWQDHGARPEHYDQWVDCLIATARIFDNQFGETTEDAWRAVMQRIVRVMQRPQGAPHVKKP